MTDYMTPTSRITGNAFEDVTAGTDPLWLLTVAELEALPTDGSVCVESVMGNHQQWEGGILEDRHTRAFRLPNGLRLDPTAWGVRAPRLARPQSWRGSSAPLTTDPATQDRISNES